MVSSRRARRSEHLSGLEGAAAREVDKASRSGCASMRPKVRATRRSGPAPSGGGFFGISSQDCLGSLREEARRTAALAPPTLPSGEILSEMSRAAAQADPCVHAYRAHNSIPARLNLRRDWKHTTGRDATPGHTLTSRTCTQLHMQHWHGRQARRLTFARGANLLRSARSNRMPRAHFGGRHLPG